MSFETVKRIVDEISELHLLSSDGHINPYIVGEPLMHPQADQIFKYIKSKSLKILLNTNASLLTSDTIKFLYDIHIDKITINLSKNKDEFYMRKPKLSYEEHLGNVTDAVKQHIKRNPSTELEFLINMFRQADSVMELFFLKEPLLKMAMHMMRMVQHNLCSVFGKINMVV